MHVDLGEFVRDEDIQARRRVAILGRRVVRELFGDESALGQPIRIAGGRYRVVGVMEEKGRSLGFDLDDLVFIPATTAMDQFGLRRTCRSFSPRRARRRTPPERRRGDRRGARAAAQRRAGVYHSEPGRPAQDLRRAHRGHDADAPRHRVGVPRRRRHRHHEHHAGERARADARDRRAARRRGHAGRHPLAVSPRGRGDLHHRRGHRARARRGHRRGGDEASRPTCPCGSRAGSPRWPSGRRLWWAWCRGWCPRAAPPRSTPSTRSATSRPAPRVGARIAAPRDDDAREGLRGARAYTD
jgi:hypothetical protein